MANQLTMALIDTILTLHERGWSGRRIARELGIDRETVARYLRCPPSGSNPAEAPLGSADAGPPSKPATAPLGSADAGPPSKPAQAPLGSAAAEPPLAGEADLLPPHAPGRVSDCAPWRETIVAKLAQGLSAQRIFQDLHDEHGYTGSYYSVRRFVQRLEQQTPLPFRRLECAAGEEVQVDFGSGAPVVLDGSGRRTHVFRVVLSHSRKGYSEAVFRQRTEDFLGCLENAFWAFGGVPRQVVLDNLKAAVEQADWYDPELNPRVRSFAAHYGTVFLPTRPYTPRHKGKVERGIDYVQENALKGRRFGSLEEENAWLREWEQSVADTRVHGTIRQQVGKFFVAVERPALLPLPAERFPFFHEGQRKVHRDGYVEVARSYYSVPPEYVGRRLWVRWDARLVRVLNERLEQVAVHVRQQPGCFSTDAEHIAKEKRAGVERGAAWLLDRIRLLGGQAARWAEGVLQQRGVEGMRVLQGLVSLAGRYPAGAIDRACGIALSDGDYRLRALRALVGTEAARQQAPAFVQEDALLRPLAEYQQVVENRKALED